MHPAKCRKLLVSLRAGAGWLSVLAPNLIGRAWRMQVPLARETKYAIRLFGIRNVVLAYQLYQAERLDAEVDELEEAIRQGIAVDSFDLIFALGSRERSQGEPSPSAVPFVASALGGILGGLGREPSSTVEESF